MTKRITVMIDDENLKKLRNLQSKRIRESEKSVSLSNVINETIKKGMKD
jgi:hypothetical protein